MLKKSIPNTLTLLNLVCGVLGILAAFQEAWPLTFVFFLVALGLDFLDGAVARALHAQSEMGKQLDSLSDMVSFGVLPGVVMVLTIAQYIPNWQISALSSSTEASYFLPLVALLIPVSTAWRLGKFNLLDTNAYFLGLPSPGNALLVMSVPMIFRSDKSPEALLSFLGQSEVLALFCVLSAFLLNAPIRLFTLKFKGGSFQDNIVPILFLLASLVLLLTLGYLGIPLVVVLYILMSLLGLPPKEKNA